MQHKKTITVNGVVYDLESGKPVARSTEGVVIKHEIKKFAKHAPAAPTAHAKKPDITPVVHPIAAKAHATQAKRAEQRVLKPSHIIKQQAIQEAMEQAKNHSRKPVKPKKPLNKFQKILRVASAGAMVLIVGAYLMYASMPAITTSVAAAQAGIRASYPSYTPSGYALNGPVAYTNGTVSMHFAAASAPVAYTIQQARSSWDSSAVLENYITPSTGEKYATTQANGLTIYTYGQNAAWVNGGIFYTISGNAPLSGEQVQRIAISL